MKEIFFIINLMAALNATAQQRDGAYVPKQPPIPIEVVVGQNSSMYQMIVSKQITPGSKFGFFNLINYEVTYDDFAPNSYIIQSIVNYEIVKGLGVGAGANFKSFGGFKPIAVASYSYFNRDIGFLVQPSVELAENGNYEVFTMFEWHPVNAKKIQPYFRVQGLLTFNDEHAFSYHYWRIGIQYKGFRVGPGLNVQYVGPNVVNTTNLGGYFSILIP
ncbi:MAG TPA: hypothetical protein DCE41_08260 [Cytophagales bacterium]|nr:hypothetical protein [Cytophagales bacterium]HAA17728.1 hypothetical protein [Cytophagales bacterium]HAP58037.1 hypothetical protein [Cytophagales bacterium]